MTPATTSPRMPFAALAAAAGVHLAVLAAAIGVWNVEPLTDEIRAIEVEIAAIAEPTPPQPEARPEAQTEAQSEAQPPEPEPPVVTEAPPIDPSLIPLLEPPPQLVLQAPKPPPPKPVAPKPAPPAIAAPAPPSPLPPALTAPAPPAAAARQTAPDPRYIDRLAAAIERERDYPVAARRRGEQGRVTLAIVIATNGRLISAEVVGSSGFDALDKAALGMVRRATLPPLAAGLGAESASFTIPIVFAVR